MPGSREDAITDITHHVRCLFKGRVQRKRGSILDVGCGFAKWGLLFREYLDLCYVGWDRTKWVHIIDAVESYKPYIQDWYYRIYDYIFNIDYLELIKTKPQILRPKYDVIYFGDVIEHWNRRDAMEVLRLSLPKADRIIISTPVKNKAQEAKLGNERERHLDFWTRGDLLDLKSKLSCDVDVRQIGALWVVDLWK